nr:acyl-CoA dehydrogenase [Fibrobacterota bacterium]
QFKKISYKIQEKIVTKGAIHARLADMAMWLHASACVLSKLDKQLQQGTSGAAWERDRAAGLHFLDMAEHEYRNAVLALFKNPDDTMVLASTAALAYSDTLPNAHFVLPERSPNAMGQGKKVKTEFVKQFPGTPS